ncbi:helix-turn-helix domain-containing protein [Candidatus Gottesmanbacteria bacterium]|nr:helix-turn-helix domain-containing protein [Candidatus Gottesmanbacteria bacterium]MBM4305352.1 helix-turn-helix domain-containing protein [Deltaproteobacteria bacterium]
MERQKEKDQGLEPREEWNHKDELSQGFLNIRQIADYLGIKASTIYSLVERKGIPHYRVGRLVRFRKTEVDEWMAGQRKVVVDVKMEVKEVLRSIEKKSDLNVDRIVKKSIDEVRGNRYTSKYGKPDRIGGLRKEAKNGTL